MYYVQYINTTLVDAKYEYISLSLLFSDPIGEFFYIFREFLHIRTGKLQRTQSQELEIIS